MNRVEWIAVLIGVNHAIKCMCKVNWFLPHLAYYYTFIRYLAKFRCVLRTRANERARSLALFYPTLSLPHTNTMKLGFGRTLYIAVAWVSGGVGLYISQLCVLMCSFPFVESINTVGDPMHASRYNDPCRPGTPDVVCQPNGLESVNRSFLHSIHQLCGARPRWAPSRRRIPTNIAHNLISITRQSGGPYVPRPESIQDHWSCSAA